MKTNFLTPQKILCILLTIAVIIALGVISKSFLKLRREVATLSQEIATVSQSVTTLSQGVIELSKKVQLLPVEEALAKLLKTYSAYDENGPLKLMRHGREYDGGYVVAEKSFELADVLLGYGISDDNSFEDQFSVTYNKPSYGFDCGVESINSKSKLFTLVQECISSDAFLYNKEESSNKVTSFNTQIRNLNLTDKKLFIKMDIEGAEYLAFPEILKHQANITGIVLEIHFSGTQTKDALNLLKQLDKDFLLIHVHGNNCTGLNFETPNSMGQIPGVIELSYINKSLVTHYSLSEDQSHPLPIDQPNCRSKPDSAFTIMK